jgi:hypothetical protein
LRALNCCKNRRCGMNSEHRPRSLSVGVQRLLS